MLITKFLDVGIGGKNYNYYKELGYEMNGHNPILVSIDDLQKTSHSFVEVSCEYCGEIVLKHYAAYLKQIEESVIKKDCCKRCISRKTSEANLLLYGFENSFQIPHIKEKIKNTNIEKYGFENVSQNDEIKSKKIEKFSSRTKDERIETLEKTRKTSLEKYGETSYTKTNEYLEKVKETCLEKYGVENQAKSKIVRDKYKQTCLEKYGSDNYFSSDEFKNYIKNYWMNDSGVDHYSKTDDFRNKIKFFWENISEEQLNHKRESSLKTCQERYGVDFVLQLPGIRKTLYDKTGYPTSKKQIMLCNIIRKRFPDILENIEFHPYLLDMMISNNNINLVIEYDCAYWHKPEIDKRKNDSILSKGYKLLRIKSGKLMPDENILFEKIYNLLDTNSMYSEIILTDWDEELYQKEEK